MPRTAAPAICPSCNVARTGRASRSDGTCQRCYGREFWLKNQDRLSVKNRERYAKNPQSVLRRNREWAMNNKEKVQASHQRYYETHKAELIPKLREYDRLHPEIGRKSRKRWRERNRETIRARAAIKTRERKNEVIQLLDGARCACCGESRFEFMTVDHINGGGHQHRRSVGVGGKFYDTVLRDPDAKAKYRILCMNCNFALGIYGRCPRKNT